MMSPVESEKPNGTDFSRNDTIVRCFAFQEKRFMRCCSIFMARL